MLDKLITYIVCWYNTLYQVLSVVWTNRITTRRDVILVHTTGSTWYSLVPPHCHGYVLCQKNVNILKLPYTFLEKDDVNVFVVIIYERENKTQKTAKRNIVFYSGSDIKIQQESKQDLF
jgi:hypothetical protein